MKNHIITLYDLYHDPPDHIHEVGYRIYKITNKITNQIYIGDFKTSIYSRFFKNWTNNAHFQVYERIISGEVNNSVSGYKYNSMRKYGLDNFTLEILPHSELFTEEYYINLFKSHYKDLNYLNKRGFNATKNGRRVNHSDVSNIKDFKLLTKNEKSIFVPESRVELLLSEGWVLGISNYRKLFLKNEYLNSKGRFSRESIKKASLTRLKNKTGFYSELAIKNRTKTMMENKVALWDPEVKLRRIKTQKDNKIGIFADNHMKNFRMNKNFELMNYIVSNKILLCNYSFSKLRKLVDKPKQYNLFRVAINLIDKNILIELIITNMNNLNKQIEYGE